MGKPSRTIAEILAALKEGDEGPECAWREIHELYYKKIHAYLSRRASPALSNEDRDELVNDVFLGACKGLPGLRGAFEAWLLGIARNRLADWFRRRSTEAPYKPRPLEPKDQEVASPEADPEVRSLERERLSGMIAAVSRLPPQMRRVRILRIQGYTFREIGELLQISEGAAKKLDFEARKALKRDGL